MLKYKEVKYFEVYYSDLEKFLKEVYNLKSRPSIVAMQEYSNDMSDSFDIHPEDIDEYDQTKLNEFKETGYAFYPLRIVLTDLCNRGLIPEGSYLLQITW